MCAALLLVLTHTTQALPPPAPVITWPPPGAVVASNRPDIDWTGVTHDAYEVHIGSQNVPTSADGWNSGQVFTGASSIFTAMTNPLPPQQTYYVFVRMHNADGWGNWSPQNNHFYVDGELLNDSYFVGDSAGFQWPQHHAFNPDRNEYLVAFPSAQPSQRSRISYYRLDSTGARIGAETTILDDAYLDGVHEGLVAYNHAAAEYLIAYTGWTQDNTPQVHDDVRIQRVNAVTGALIGPSVLLYTAAPEAREPEISYSTRSNVYLVAWHDVHSVNGWRTLGYRLNGATAAITGGQIVISTGWSRLTAVPNIAYNSSAADEFMCMYQVDREDIGNGWDQYCQRVRASDGALLGGTMPVATAFFAWDDNGDIEYDSDMNRYLAVYESVDGTNSIYGQFINADGTQNGGRFVVLGSPYGGGLVGVAWLPSTKEYLAAWQNCCTNDDYARRISQTGTLIGERFKTNGTVIGNGNYEPLPLVNTVNNEFLITWYNTYNDVYNRRYKTYPPPAPDVTPPASATSLALARFPSSISMTWTNPSTADFMGTTIRFKTTGFPTGPTDGTFLVDQPNAPSTSDSYVHTGLVSGITYYYAAFAHDEASNYAAPALASAKVLIGDFDNDGDVDLVDFAHLQLCFSGDGNPYAAGCVDADLNEDGSVGNTDFNLFAPCIGGANNPSGC